MSDGNGGSDTATASITVNPVNDNPVGVSPFASVSSVDPNNPPAGTPIGQELEAITPIDGGSMFTDIDNDVLTYSLGSGTPNWVSVNSITGQITGTPPIDASAGGLSGNGVHTIILIASDGNGGVTTLELPLVIEVPIPANPDGSSGQTGGDDEDFGTGENISGGSQSSDTSFSGTTGGIRGNTGSASALSGGIGSDGQGPGQVGEFLASGSTSLSGSWSPPSESEQNTQYQPSFGGNDSSSAFGGLGSPFGSGNSLDGIANSLGGDGGLGSFGRLDPVSNPDTLNDQVNFDEVSNSPTASATQKFRASPDILKAGSFTDIDIGDFINTFRFEVSFTATEIYLHLLSLKEQLQYEINDWKLGFKKAEIDSKLLRKIDSKLYGVNRSITSETTELVTTISLKNGQTVTLTFVINTTTGEISDIKTIKTGSNAYETYTPDPSSIDATREYLAQDVKERPTDKLLRALRLA